MKRKKIFRILTGSLLVLAGIVCFLYPDAREWKTQKAVDEIAGEFEKMGGDHSMETEEQTGSDRAETEVPPDCQETDNTALPDMAELYVKMLDYNRNLAECGQEITDAWSYEQPPVDMSPFFEEGEAIGYIEIPDMGIRLPLLLGASKDNLAEGAAVLSGTSLPIGGEDTNCVIAGHRGYRGSAYFRDIDQMREGSMVYVVNPWGTLSYQATGIQIVAPCDLASVLIQKGKDMLTLLTCHPYASGGRQRYLVYCERLHTPDEAKEETVDVSEEKTERRISIPDAETEQKIKDYTEWNEEVQTQDLMAGLERQARGTVPVLTLILAGVILILRYLREKR